VRAPLPNINPGAIRITVTALKIEDSLQQAAGRLPANDAEMLACLVEAERKAGTAIMTVYRSPVSVEQKADRSPVTAADRLSHEIVTATLKRDYAFPVLSEEGKSIEYDERRRWDAFWLVDPLDGTKEFINGNGEFTVNIALIRGGVPVMGVIYVPVKDLLYYAVKGGGAYKIEHGLTVRLPLRTERKDCTVVGSRSHASREFEEYVRTLRARHEDLAFVSAGSSLKFCLVAEGTADLYPRLGTTMEWDTAAGQLIVEEAGGRVVDASDGRPLRYNKADLRNPHFIATGREWHD
jgi:3'(2'), 5'-bisphosphate nucleotidase